MNTVTNYLEQKLKNSSQYDLTKDDEHLIKEDNVEQLVFSRLASKKFRKWKLADTCVTKTKIAIKKSISNQEPIHAVYFQGGYKLWRLPSSPEADWAEFFNISFVIEYLAPIAKAYKPGVDLVYYVHTLLMEKHDNLTTQEIEKYIGSLQMLVNEFCNYLPSNFTIKIVKDADIYPREEYFRKLEDGVEKAKEQYSALSKEKKDNYSRMGRLNIKWHGKEDWSQLTQEQKDEKVYQGILYEMAATSNLPKVAEAVKGEDKVCLFTSSAPIFIGIGSTKTSITKHWTGFGVLEHVENHYYDRILSPQQFEDTQKLPHEVYKVSLFSLKNLQEIKVYEGRFDFRK